MKTVEEINQNEILVDGDLFIRKTKNPNDVPNLFPNKEELDKLVNDYSCLKPDAKQFIYAAILNTINFIKGRLGYK